MIYCEKLFVILVDWLAVFTIKNKTKENKDALLEIFDEEILEQYEDLDLEKFNREAVNRLIGKKKK
jgi:hypothetical protein